MPHSYVIKAASDRWSASWQKLCIKLIFSANQCVNCLSVICGSNPELARRYLTPFLLLPHSVWSMASASYKERLWLFLFLLTYASPQPDLLICWSNVSYHSHSLLSSTAYIMGQFWLWLTLLWTMAFCFFTRSTSTHKLFSFSSRDNNKNVTFWDQNSIFYLGMYLASPPTIQV